LKEVNTEPAPVKNRKKGKKEEKQQPKAAETAVDNCMETPIMEKEEMKRVPEDVVETPKVAVQTEQGLEMNKEEAQQVLLNFQVDPIPEIMSKTPKTAKREESKPSNVYIAELQALKREHEELKSKYEFLQKRGVDEANTRFLEFKALAEKRFEESEQLISLLQKENERVKTEHRGSEVAGEPSKEVQELKAKLMQQQAKEELQTQTLTSLLQEKKQLELKSTELAKELAESRSQNESAAELNKKLESSVTTWKAEYESVKKELQNGTKEHIAKVSELEQSIIPIHVEISKLEVASKEESTYTEALERLVGLYEQLTGIRIQNVQATEKQDVETENMLKYNEFEIKQKGTSKSIPCLTQVCNIAY
jgi:DNA repair exonuclease SbcCD ATPase subunit